MSIWKLVAGVTLVFILGLLVGSVGTGFYLKHGQPPPSQDPKARAAFIMKKLSKELELTQDQKVAIEKTVAQMTERLHEHFVHTRPEVKKIIDESFSQIKKELTEDQKAKLDVLREKFERRRPSGRER